MNTDSSFFVKGPFRPNSNGVTRLSLNRFLGSNTGTITFTVDIRKASAMNRARELKSRAIAAGLTVSPTSANAADPVHLINFSLTGPSAVMRRVLGNTPNARRHNSAGTRKKPPPGPSPLSRGGRRRTRSLR